MRRTGPAEFLALIAASMLVTQRGQTGALQKSAASPGANEYVGAPRYMRDEPGTTPHLRGAVGISTRGHDTGDGQIFIDLVDLPGLDRDYTVFARVTSGMEVADRVTRGGKDSAGYVEVKRPSESP